MRKDNTVLGRGLGAGVQIEPSGRWPANFAPSHCVTTAPTLASRIARCGCWMSKLGLLKAGRCKLAQYAALDKVWFFLGVMPAATKRDTHGDSGSASRFFYVAKASTKERSAGLPDRNSHPTVKSSPSCDT